MTVPDDSGPKAVLPPRPNPGPEPWPSAGSSWLAGILIFVSLLALAILLWRWLRSRRTTAQLPCSEFDPLAETLSREAQLIHQANVVRSALSQHYGAGWSAKTTEQVEASLKGMESFDLDARSNLLRLLREADRCKFASFNPLDDDQGDDFAAWASVALAALATGATSKTSAK